MNISGFKFSKWYKWVDRRLMPDIKFRGVYVVSIGKKILYIGETHDQTLHRRLYQFDRSAFCKKDGSSGGWTFYLKGYAKKKNQIKVAVLPAKDMSEIEASAFAQFAERKLVWDYVKKHGDRPPCNKK